MKTTAGTIRSVLGRPDSVLKSRRTDITETWIYKYPDGAVVLGVGMIGNTSSDGKVYEDLNDDRTFAVVYSSNVEMH